MKKAADPWSLPEDAKAVLRERFSALRDPVTLWVFTKKGENDPFNAITIAFAQELTQLSEKITVQQYSIGEKVSKDHRVNYSPTMLIQPQTYKIRYIGAPMGEEGRSFIETLLLVSQKQSNLSAASKKMLAQLKDPRDVQVFVTLSCPYCPGQVLHAFRAAIERPDLVSAACVDAAENLDLSGQYGVGSVPHTVINGDTMGIGFEPEEQFIQELVTQKPVEAPPQEPLPEGHVHEFDLVIVGGGPAGLTAGIYAARSGLKTVLLEKTMVGGQVAITPVVENWPGFQNIPGKQLMDMISVQAKHYVPIMEGEEVQEIKVGRTIEALTSRNHFKAKAVILATGTAHRKLRVPGEERFAGHGVSYCATCDGYFYKGKQVAVVGGGNTALTDALYLKSLGSTVTLVHRGDSFNAEAALMESVNKENISVLWNTVVEEIQGEKQVTHIKIKNIKENSGSTLPVDAVFVAIGAVPNNMLATQLGLKLTKEGYIEIDRYGRTSIPRIYGAGDITGGVWQIVTAVGEGAAAALSAFQDISSPYWIPKKQ
ncbi:MAG: FAD-dependent oxidoreductase [Candidatus Thermoplasmatota archaeon]|nr:FAD-dependent oxidoreductase [Candidatus Thermoplasmatota archaeon]